MKVRQIRIMFAMSFVTVMPVMATGPDQQCQTVGATPGNSSYCGAAPDCPGYCTRNNTDCHACVGPNNHWCSSPPDPTTCSQWPELGFCQPADNRREP